MNQHFTEKDCKVVQFLSSFEIGPEKVILTKDTSRAQTLYATCVLVTSDTPGNE